MTDALRQCVSCAVIALDKKNKISLLTLEAADLIGVKADEILGNKIEALPDTLQKLFALAASSGQPVSAQTKLFHQTRGELSVQVNIAPVQNDDGKIFGAVAVLNDFSCAEKMEQKIAQIDRLASIGTLSASMAHEIKNALVAVRTFTDLLLARNQQDELAGIVGREMTRIDSIVSQMLTFSGPAKPKLAPLHLHDLLNHSLKLIQHQLDQKNVKIERSFAAASDIIKGDDYQLKQAFLNLFFNALEALQSNGSLSISTESIDADPVLAEALREKNPTQLRVIIRDSGPGIPPENLARVFEPFFTTKPKGTGLGLPITRRIINEHRATITVESEPQKGTIFNIVFPVFRKDY
ncbi:MAG: ATP-binding protein [Verrucomicrobiota bacterium]